MQLVQTSVRLGLDEMTKPTEAQQTYAVEDAFEAEMPTKTLSLAEATNWLAIIADDEGVDYPLLLQGNLSRRTDGVAFNDEWCIAVRKKQPSELLLLHEMAHLVCANKNHGREFRTQLVRFLRRYVSLLHAARLHEMFVSAGLSVDPFTAT